MKNKLKTKLLNYLLDNLDKNQKHLVLTQAVSDLFNNISDKDIFKISGQDWLFKNKKLSENEKLRLVSEAELLLKTNLWQMLQTEIRYRANKKMFLDSQTEYDLIAGKLMLYQLDIIKSVLNRITGSKNLMLHK